MRYLAKVFCILLIFSCSEKQIPDPSPSEIYFPPTGSNTWEASSPSSLDWDSTQIGDLLTLLEGNGTRAFIILKDGKIVLEEYFGTRLATNQAFDKNSLWYWASAGKTLTAATIGIAAEQNKMDIFASSSKYLGEGWTSLTRDAEQEINVWHHLTMTSGINDDVANLNDFSPENLRYQSEPGLRWAYHNALYTLLYNVVESATGMSFNDFFNQNLASKIGMTGSWQRIGFNNVYFSNARSMARFGLFILANGEWDGVSVLSKDFVQEMISTSQSINESYGYLWWINGKNSFMVPSIQAQFPGSFAPNAPDDMVCGIGKDGQYICVVPSSGIVLVRMGENPDQALVPFRFIDDIWKELNNIIVQ